MQTLALIIFAVLGVGVSGYLIKVPTTPAVGPKEAPSKSGWVRLQKLILPLFEDVCEDSTDPIIVRMAKEFSLDSSTDIYLKPEVVMNLRNLISGKGLLPKGEIFTEYNNDHMNELQIIYEVLHYAKDFDTFYRTAAWARQIVNCGLYINAIYLSVLSRRDMEKISVPPIYEILPNYFIREDVVIKASSILAGEEVELSDSIRVEGNSYVLDTNCTASFYENNDESKLVYFYEDIGLNSYYFFEKLLKAPWFNISADINSRYGEYLYHMMKQLATRCNLERYANGLPELQSIDWDSPVDVPYDPMLIYSNGKAFPNRTSSIDLQDTVDIGFIKNMENNMATVVTHMRQSGHNKTQILNHLMEMLVTSDRSYEFYARNYLTKDSVNDSGLSSVSALDHYMTSLRDPLFWKLNRKIVEVVDNALQVLPSYTRSELYFPGVELFNIDVKKMITNFDYFEFDVTDALRSINNTGPFQVKIGQPRLNHKPFSIKINISSLVTQKGLVKIYLGPKILPGELAMKKNLFMLLDCFEINLKIGKNLISRSSDEIVNLSNDITSYRTLIKQVQDAEFGLDALPLNNIETLIGFPSRLILPKGSPIGLPLQMFVFIAPFVKATVGGIYSASMEFNSAILSPGYPLDLIVEEKLLFDLPNALVKDVVLTHKGDDKVLNYGGTGETKKWYGNSYNPSTRGSFSGIKTEPFDYSSKKEQYGKKGDYTVKTGSYNEDKREDGQDEFTVIPLHVPDILISNLVSDEDINTNDVQSYRNYLLDKRPEPFDYSFKKKQYEKKEPFDYKAKKVMDRKKDNSIINDSKTIQDLDRDEVTILPMNLSNNTSINDVVPDKDLFNISIENILKNVSEGLDVAVIEPARPLPVKEGLEINNIDKVRPILRLSIQKKHVPNVYDYIVHSEDDDQNDVDETDGRVYE